VFVLLRRFIPDPVVFLQTFGHIRTLRAQIAANPGNAIARRDLANIYLRRHRPRTALALVDEALTRAPDDAELLYLRGVALSRAARAGQALEPLVRAIELKDNLLFGEPYRVAAETLTRLGKHEEAEDALLRFLRRNSSSVEGYVKLALSRKAQGHV